MKKKKKDIKKKDFQLRIDILTSELKEMNQTVINTEQSLNEFKLQIIRKQGALAELESLTKE